MREFKEKNVEILVYFENSLKFKLRINFHDFFFQNTEYVTYLTSQLYNRYFTKK